jgi:hypothetical protein
MLDSSSVPLNGVMGVTIAFRDDLRDPEFNPICAGAPAPISWPVFDIGDVWDAWDGEVDDMVNLSGEAVEVPCESCLEVARDLIRLDAFTAWTISIL